MSAGKIFAIIISKLSTPFSAPVFVLKFGDEDGLIRTFTKFEHSPNNIFS